METEPLLSLARKLISETTFGVAATQGENGDSNARVVQPMPLQDDWTVNVVTNRRCRKVREIERSGRMTLL
jgi:general stress protein 26